MLLRLLALFVVALLNAASAADLSLSTGTTGAGLEPFDEAMVRFMRKWHLPGGQLAIAKDGRLVLNRGYGYADREKQEATTPDHLFRIGSVSKTITTVAILSLVEQGRVRLDDKVFRILSDLRPAKNATIDPRIYNITVQHLLQHEAGWAQHDALELPWSRMAAATLGLKDPPDCEGIIRYALGVPLDFAPGTQSNYSNLGFCVLGRLIERAAPSRSGQRLTYEVFVQSNVLEPAGVRRMRLGGTRLADRAPGEVRYYAAPGQPLSPSVFPGEGYVPFAYGGFYLPASDAAGGWIGSAADLVRFALAIDGTRGPALMKPETVRTMLHAPMASTGSDAHSNRTRMGLCWTVVRRQDGVDFWHTGGLAGSNASWLARTSSGVTLAFTFNSLPADHTSFFGEVLPALLDLVSAVGNWPSLDLFITRGGAAATLRR